ncbi:MAG: Helix-turn-helix domain [Frankiales bacterium]|nr:Helix-turn-helix domain [Frankiales bacterium]
MTRPSLSESAVAPGSGWLTVAQAAAHVAMHEKTVRTAAVNGELSGVKTKPGHKKSEWRFRVKDLDAWLERGRVTATRRRAS